MQTIDVITPLVNEPDIFGRIGAVNAVSDVYAMGGKPLTALAFCGFPTGLFDTCVLDAILAGAKSVLDGINVPIIGGHTVLDDELKFGLAVTGVIDETGKPLSCKGAQRGDKLVITKPIGTGVLSTALKGGKITNRDFQEAVYWMTTLNEKASEVAISASATACTDVTGFGFLGHALNMVDGSNVDFLFNFESIPILQKVFDMVDYGMCPEGAYRNLSFINNKVVFSGNVTEEQKLVLSDPQTSGGLLISVCKDNVAAFEESGIFYSLVGEVIDGTGRIIVN